MTSVTIPGSVTSIGRSAFSGCSSLEEVHISNLVAWCHINFGGGTAANPVFYAKNLYLNNALLTNLIIPEEVTSIRNDTFSNCSSLTSISIPESVTRIGDYAFSDCSSLTSVTISEGVTSIGEGTFTSCSSLTSVTIPESVTSIGNNAFSWCSSLTSIKFMGSAPTFKSNTFSGVKATANHPCTDATWTDSVKANYGGSLTWKGHLFSDYVYNQDATCTENATHTGSCPDCGAIDTIPVPDTAFGHSYGEAVVTDPTCTEEGYTTYTCHCGDTYIDDRKASLGHDYIEGFCSHCGIKELWGSGQCGNDVYWELDVFGTLSISGSGSIPDYITDSVPWDQYREEIKTVMIQNGITSIGSHAFYNCSNLTSVTIPEGVTSIDGGAFWDCSSLTSVTIPESVTSIGSHAFCNCSNLTSVTIPESVISIGNDAFSNCSNLTSVTILEGVTSIGDGAFSSCSSLTGISIPEGVTSIGNYTFAFCISLTSISIPEGVTSIGYDTFSNCSNLTSVIIPESVTSIGDYAFVDCGSLTSITIPEGVTSIGRYAFRGCSSLTSIQFMGNAPTLYSNCFYGVNATVYHPCTDATWTDSVKANYGGSLTWVGHRFENGACVNCGQPTGVTLRGTITSFDAVDGAVTVRLMQGEVEVSNVVSTNGTYCLEMVAAGEYTLVISKQNHVTRTYSLTVADQDVTQNVKIHLIGDIDGNGKVNVGDTAKVYSHVKKTALITDEYMLLCADIDGNGKINVGDTAKVYAHVKKTISFGD